MFHRAKDLQFGKGTELSVVFESGERRIFDMAVLFTKYPQLEVLKERQLFLSGKMMGAYGIVWNEALDIETETIYQEGRRI